MYKGWKQNSTSATEEIQVTTRHKLKNNGQLCYSTVMKQGGTFAVLAARLSSRMSLSGIADIRWPRLWTWLGFNRSHITQLTEGILKVENLFLVRLNLYGFGASYRVLTIARN